MGKNNLNPSTIPGQRQYNRRGGRPKLDVDFAAVHDAVLGAWSGSGETITEVAARFEVSRDWVYLIFESAKNAELEQRSAAGPDLLTETFAGGSGRCFVDFG